MTLKKYEDKEFIDDEEAADILMYIRMDDKEMGYKEKQAYDLAISKLREKKK